VTRRAAGLRVAVACVAALFLSSCVGGVPKVPATPDAVLARADEYSKKGKTIQAAALYQAFLERYAGHDRADYAQFMLAQTHFDSGDYQLAFVEYQVVMSNYSYSEYVGDALFQTGVCDWKQSPKVQRDQQKTTEALGRFSQYLQTFPDGPRSKEAKQYIRQINEKLAQKAYIAARWYYRQKNGKAAMIYCDKIIDSYPENRYWAQALYMKGDILLRRGQKDDAVAQFTRVLEYPGDLPVKHDAEARIKEARK
jgi:outer membrane protein assembly factor BamD